MLGITGRRHAARRRELMPVVETRFTDPTRRPGNNWKAVLLHPGFNRRHPMNARGFRGCDQSEAIRQAWRVAMLKNLAGFKIVSWPLKEQDQ